MLRASAPFSFCNLPTPPRRKPGRTRAARKQPPGKSDTNPLGVISPPSARASGERMRMPQSQRVRRSIDRGSAGGQNVSGSIADPLTMPQQGRNTRHRLFINGRCAITQGSHHAHSQKQCPFPVRLQRTDRQKQYPEIVDFYLPPEGCSYRLAVVSIKKEYPGRMKRIFIHNPFILAFWFWKEK